jgi:glycosyltransferase involved in cell wall biosynthesis
MARRIAYVLNQYPKVSHSFIRREIQALERLGLSVQRFAIRDSGERLADPEDVREYDKTRFVLRAGVLGMAAALVALLMTRPARVFAAFALATRMGRRADRPMPYHWIYFAEACLVARWADAAGVEHFHAHFGTNPTEVAALAAVLTGKPYSFTAHGPEEFDKPRQIALSEKVHRSAFVVAISSFGRSQLFRWVEHAHWPKIRVVHCGIEVATLGEAASPCTAPRLVCVGRICEQKGQLLLVECMARLRDRGVTCELVLAGDGEMRADVETLIARHGLGDRIRITGWISGDQVRREIEGARALVLPSFAEGLPVVIMEAMAVGRPVLSTFVAGIPELVVHGANGWLFPAGDLDALTGAMQACLAAPAAVLAAMGAAASERARARHDIDLVAEQLAELFANGAAG